MLSRIANFDDFDPLRHDPSVRLDFIPPGRPLPGDADMVILPGTKATIADLGFFRSQGWDVDLAAHVRRGGRVLGICGGFQMLGRSVADPDGLEGSPSSTSGLGYLAADSVLMPEKTVGHVSGTLVNGAPFVGYEIHAGRTTGSALDRPLAVFADGRRDGAVAGKIMGTYVHGLFNRGEARAAVLKDLDAAAGGDHEARIEAALDEIAERLAQVLDVKAIADLAGLGPAGRKDD
jgi:adenosylcobyric acid synthase